MADTEEGEIHQFGAGRPYRLVVGDVMQDSKVGLGGLASDAASSDLVALLKEGDDDLREPLLNDVDEGDQEALEFLDKESEVKDTFIPATLNVSKAILGSGLMVIPRAFQVLGAALGTLFLAIVGVATWFTISGLLYSADKTGKPTYASVIRTCCGKVSKYVLLVVLIVNCFGLMAVFSVICADILVGTLYQPAGLIQELFPSLFPSGLVAYRNPILGALLTFVLFPLSTFVPLNRLGAVNVIGVASIGFFAISSVVLAVTATAKGLAYPIQWVPNLTGLGTTGLSKTIAVLNILPIILNSDVCHQSIFPAMSVLEPYTRTRMNKVAGTALVLCNVLYAVIAICCGVVFGPALDSDVLNNFSVATMSPIVGPVGAYGIAVSVRFGYLLSLIGSFALCMHPLRHCCLEIILRHKYHVIGGAAAEKHPVALPLAAALTLGMFFVAVYVPSVWLLLSLIGAAAATLMAFIFPGLAVLVVCEKDHRAHQWRRVAAVCVIALGVLLFVNGFLAFFVWSV